jgi:hypothetical protein
LQKQRIPSIYNYRFRNVSRQWSITADGGQIAVNKPGDPLNGLTIEVPVNAYEEDKTFIVREASIKEHGLDPTLTLLRQ